MQGVLGEVDCDAHVFGIVVVGAQLHVAFVHPYESLQCPLVAHLGHDDGSGYRPDS